MRSFLVALSTAFAGVMLSGCLESKDFEVRSVAISDLNALGNEETVVGIDIGLYNPNGYKVQIEESRLGFWVGVDSVGVLQFVPGVEIGGKKEGVVRVDAVLDSKLFSNVISRNWFEYLVQGAPVRVEGWVRGKARGVRRTLQIRHEQRLSILN